MINKNRELSIWTALFKIEILQFLIFVAPKLLLSQVMAGGNNAAGIELNTNAGGLITEVDYSSDGDIGSFYLYKEKHLIGDILFEDGSLLEQVVFFLDLKNEQVVSVNRNVNVDSFYKIFNIQSDHVSEIYKANQFSSSEGSLDGGFLEIVYAKEEPWAVVRHSYLKTTEPNHIAALNVGMKNRRYSTFERYMVMSDSLVFRYRSNYKKFARDLVEVKNQKDLVQFMRTEVIVDEVQSLVTLVNYLNQIAKD